MIPGFENIVEERIKQAQKKGQFDNLKGLSKPLKFEEYQGPEELRMAHKILKNAGFLPPEIESLSETLKEIDMRVILMSPEEHKKIKELLPQTKIHFSKSCNCGF